MNKFHPAIPKSFNKKVSVFTLSILIFLLFSFLNSAAQTGIQWKCGSDIMRQKNFNEHPQTKLKNDSIENAMYLSIPQQLQQKQLGGGGTLPTPQQIYTIPVVVHIIHNNGPENISDAQVITGIQHLNDAFRNVGVFDPSTGVDVEIEFCLAKQDENGNFTTGINRIVSAYTNMTMETDDITLKNLIRWDPTQYMNIWLVKEITSLSVGSAVVGYAVFPSSHGNPEDGIVVEPNYFGYSSDNSKIAVHEVGHYLGLYHTFEDCSNNNCLTNGDKVCDTPPDASTSSVSCSANINSCVTDDDDLSSNNPFRPIANGGLGDQNDMIINYMDYGHQICQSAFTLGQKNRMVPFLTGIRNSLLQSIACNSVCTNPLVAFFSASAVNVTAGTSVSFGNNSSGATGYIWQLNGTTFSVSANSSYIFNTQGTYTVKLIASNSDPACTDEYTITVTITCPVTTSFTVSSNNISPGDNVTFTNTSTGATSYQWYIDGTAMGSTTNFNHIFPTVGGFMVSLTASNGICSTTFYQYLNVGCISKETNIWYFGLYAGLDFNSGVPVVLTNGALYTDEGCATISTSTGVLRFYTDGVTVWNNQHNQMSNGTGLMGHSSTTQSAIIVPKPGNPDIYYIFTADYQGNPNGLRYSEVDMALSGGLGDVTATKNIPLATPVTEKITAVKKANNIDFWVIAHDLTTNAFLVYSVTNSGVNTTSIISNAGSVEYPGPSPGVNYLKASADGSKLVQSLNNPGMVDVLNFNNATGIVTNGFTFPSYSYGVEFSPDSKRLYAFSYPSDIYQYNMTLGTSSAIIASATIVATSASLNLGALQIAPDGKIYVAKYYNETLGCINNPNSLGVSCNFVDSAINLLGMRSMLGLPNFIPSFFYNGAPAIAGPNSVCSQNVTYLQNTQGFNSVNWSLQGNGIITSSSDSTCTVAFNGSGIDTLMVEAIGNCGAKRDTIFITVLQTPSLDLGADTVICQGGSITLNAGTGYTSYLWQDASTNPTYSVNAPGLYKVIVTNGAGCSATDSILVNLATPITSLNLGPDVFSCNGGITLLDAGSGFSTYEWQDGSTNQKYTVYMPGKYWVTVSSCGNTASDTITVFWQSNISFSISKEGELCAGQTVTLNADPTSLASYIWDDGTSSYTRDVLTHGTYWLIVTDATGCYGQDSIEILVSDCDTTIDCGTVYVPNAFTPSSSYFLNDAFKPIAGCVHDYTFLIFNRWGEKLFETTNINEGWNGYYKGKMCIQDIYVYKIYFVDDSKNKTHQYIGKVTLLR